MKALARGALILSGVVFLVALVGPFFGPDRGSMTGLGHLLVGWTVVAPLALLAAALSGLWLWFLVVQDGRPLTPTQRNVFLGLGIAVAIGALVAVLATGASRGEAERARAEEDTVALQFQLAEQRASLPVLRGLRCLLAPETDAAQRAREELLAIASPPVLPAEELDRQRELAATWAEWRAGLDEAVCAGDAAAIVAAAPAPGDADPDSWAEVSPGHLLTWEGIAPEPIAPRPASPEPGQPDIRFLDTSLAIEELAAELGEAEADYEEALLRSRLLPSAALRALPDAVSAVAAEAGLSSEEHERLRELADAAQQVPHEPERLLAYVAAANQALGR